MSAEKTAALNNGELSDRTDQDTQFKCSCKFNAGEPCSLQFFKEELLGIRLSNEALKRNELDMVILGQIRAGIHCNQSTLTTKRRHQVARKRIRLNYRLHGSKICRQTFIFAHGISKSKLTNLIAHFSKNGIASRRHGNTLPKNPITCKQEPSTKPCAVMLTPPDDTYPVILPATPSASSLTVAVAQHHDTVSLTPPPSSLPFTASTSTGVTVKRKPGRPKKKPRGMAAKKLRSPSTPNHSLLINNK